EERADRGIARAQGQRLPVGGRDIGRPLGGPAPRQRDLDHQPCRTFAIDHANGKLAEGDGRNAEMRGAKVGHAKVCRAKIINGRILNARIRHESPAPVLGASSVPLPTLASLCSTDFCKRRKQRDTSNLSSLAWLWI